MTDKRARPTDAELDILGVLWQNGPSTVKQVHERLPDTPHRGYTTVLKLMQIMSEKGLVRRDEGRRAHVYEACLSREQTQRSLLSHLLDRAFDGSAQRLVMQALSTRTSSKGELAQIRRLIDQIEEESQ